MSWAEEQPWFGLEDLALEAMQRQEDAMELIKQGIWVQKNGKKINLVCMTDRHLTNCINMIENGRLNRPWALPYLKREQQRRLKLCSSK